MASTRRTIQFENNSPKVCYSGDLVRGKAEIYFPIPTRVQDIYLTFFGKGFCEWSEGGKQIIGSKTYLDERVDLLQNSSEAGVVIPSGNNSYPFEVRLPSTIPTSYEGTLGYIRYCTALHIIGSTEKLDPLVEAFTVIHPLNLNNSPTYREPMKVRKFTKFNISCCLFCVESDELQLYARLPVRGYCSGQTINLKLDVINKSYQEVLRFLVQFIQEVTYTANNGKQKVERIAFKKRVAEGVRADVKGRHTRKVNITVPSLPPTNFSADVCGSRYMFIVTAETPMCHRNPSFEIPIVIGTSPISSELYASMTDASDTNRASAPPLSAPNTSVNSTNVPHYPDGDPPTYEEAMRSVVAPKMTKDFLPKYPTYRGQTSYASDEPSD
ncbi:Arrestin domain-containing protein 17 [Pseudolycoriella hygida]|uniref:Arrestin domain-containing protein 17 n=1 Tax=Pseudolycoriella hygida TaxID=35572 RepID=A0A9Q0N0J2_9DIPT|nr:Arrestin domain-containing protein 17 [Pseudolycoriella hygida]